VRFQPRRLAKRLTPERFRKLHLEKLVAALSAEQRDWARGGVDNAPVPFIPELEYTESRIEWVALYAHCQRGQIDPSILRRMRDVDLEYLAASPPPAEYYRLKADGGSREEQLARQLKAAKLHANVTRATRELQRRYTIRIGVTIAAVSVLFGASTSLFLN
jgi:hypothetical protein